MQITKTWLIPAAVAALIITGGTALACNGGFGGHGARHGGPHAMGEGHFAGGFGAQTFGLRAAYRVSDPSDQQRAELDKVFAAAQDSAYEKLKGWRVDRRALRDALRNGADPATIKPLADKAGQHVAEIIVMRAETRAEVSAVLTPEQRTELEKMSRHRSFRGFDRRTSSDPMQAEPQSQRL